MLILCLLFVPIFILVARTQPDMLYTRLFSQSFEGAVIEFNDTESFSLEKISNARPGIYAFGDAVVYADSNIILAAPSDFFDSGELSRSFEEVFSMIAVYNMYIPRFLLPMLMIAFLILLILQFAFYLLSVCFLGISRMTSTRFVFGDRLKIVIMTSLPSALISSALGFALPAVHIVLFQMLNLPMLFFLSKRYDKKERELLLSEENAEPIGVNS
ncbi:MAG: hypothetical protein FWG72_09440 [Oscillospiraceae bacterium]|nr:hypothetical protein [Oscillospiraceae bacterium]